MGEAILRHNACYDGFKTFKLRCTEFQRSCYGPTFDRLDHLLVGKCSESMGRHNLVIVEHSPGHVACRPDACCYGIYISIRIGTVKDDQIAVFELKIDTGFCKILGQFAGVLLQFAGDHLGRTSPQGMNAP